MKYIPVLIIISLILIFSCGYSEVRNQNLQRPAFDVQKTYYMTKTIFEFLPTYYIYNSRIETYYDAVERKKNTFFKISKKADFSKNVMIISDLKKDLKIYLEEKPNKSPGDESINYIITDNNDTIATIKQKSRFDYMKYDFFYNNAHYSLEGKINKYGDIIHSFTFSLSKDENTYAYFFKEYNYFRNEHEIIINRKEKNISDPVFIATCAFIDLVLKENGYEYRS